MIEDVETPRGFRFNPDERWQQFVYTKYQGVISRIAFKYCMSDEDLREDLEQEAMIALMTILPEEIDGHEAFLSGDIGERDWNRKIDTYCRQVIRNSVLAVLGSPRTGNWYVGRKKRRKNPVTKQTEYVSTPAVYVSLESMLRDVQIGTDGVLYISNARPTAAEQVPHEDAERNKSN